MLIKTLPVGMLGTNCYIVTDEKTLKCAIIDPGADSNSILDYIETNNITPEAIFITHGHFDHFMALEEVREETKVPVYIHEADVDRGGHGDLYRMDCSIDVNYYSDGDVIQVGNLEFFVIETPGHSPGSVTLRCEEALFTGDTLFCGDCGRTDIGDGCRDTILKSLKKLSELKGDYEVYPGHEESTTLERERNYNPDMQLAMSAM